MNITWDTVRDFLVIAYIGIGFFVGYRTVLWAESKNNEQFASLPKKLFLFFFSAGFWIVGFILSLAKGKEE